MNEEERKEFDELNSKVALLERKLNLIATIFDNVIMHYLPDHVQDEISKAIDWGTESLNDLNEDISDLDDRVLELEHLRDTN